MYINRDANAALSIEDVARIAHGAHRLYAAALGEATHPPPEPPAPDGGEGRDPTAEAGDPAPRGKLHTPLYDWVELDEEARVNLALAAQRYVEHPTLTAATGHEAWCRYKLETGWEFGEELDVDARLHPDLVTWDELALPQRIKGELFGAVCRALAPLVKRG
jgi:hypothetical protein